MYNEIKEVIAMNIGNYEIVDIDLQKLVPFKFHSSQTYGGERLGQLMASIEKSGLINPIIVRPISDGKSVKYEIICGHNRTKAVRKLGHETISAVVREDLSDDDAIGLYYDSNLNQQSFADWNYSQKIEAVKYCDKIIKDTSRQGKRSDLEKEIKSESSTTSVYTRQKSGIGSKQSTARDKMARRLGISTATFSKYRSIIKLADDLVKSIASLLDQKMITFEAAYKISGLEPSLRVESSTEFRA